MNLVIEKKTFIEIEKINNVKNHIDKLVSKNIEDSKADGQIEISLSYSDNNLDDCYKVLTFDYSLLLEEIRIVDIALGKVSIFVVEGQGVNIEYSLNIIYEAKKEIEVVDDTSNLNSVNQPEVIVETNNDSLVYASDAEELKEEIKDSYEEKLDEELDERNDIKIVSSKDNRNELDFLSFFDNNVAKKFKIKTLECNSKSELKDIAAKYNLKVEVLEAGYDSKLKTVTFKLDE